ATPSGELLLFSPNVLNRNMQVPNRYRNRKLPLRIERGFMDEDQYEINLPEGFAIEFIPEAVSVENKFGKYTVNTERISDTKLRYTRMFTVSEGLYPKEDYNVYRDFIKEVSNNDQAKIVLIKNQ